MGLACALTLPGGALGVVALSGRLLPQVIEQIQKPELLTGLPVFVGHGTDDPLVSIGHGREIHDRLQGFAGWISPIANMQWRTKFRSKKSAISRSG